MSDDARQHAAAEVALVEEALSLIDKVLALAPAAASGKERRERSGRSQTARSKLVGAGTSIFSADNSSSGDGGQCQWGPEAAVVSGEEVRLHTANSFYRRRPATPSAGATTSCPAASTAAQAAAGTSQPASQIWVAPAGAQAAASRAQPAPAAAAPRAQALQPAPPPGALAAPASSGAAQQATAAAAEPDDAADAFASHELNDPSFCGSTFSGGWHGPPLFTGLSLAQAAPGPDSPSQDAAAEDQPMSPGMSLAMQSSLFMPSNPPSREGSQRGSLTGSEPRTLAASRQASARAREPGSTSGSSLSAQLSRLGSFGNAANAATAPAATLSKLASLKEVPAAPAAPSPFANGAAEGVGTSRRWHPELAVKVGPGEGGPPSLSGEEEAPAQPQQRPRLVRSEGNASNDEPVASTAADAPKAGPAPVVRPVRAYASTAGASSKMLLQTMSSGTSAVAASLQKASRNLLGGRIQEDTACVKLGARLLAARGLMLSAKKPLTAHQMPVALAYCEGNKQSVTASGGGTDAAWDAFFVFTVTKPAYAVFRLKVVVPGKCLGHTNIGEIEMSVKAVKDEPTKFGQANWYPVRWKGQTHGEVQLQLYYSQEQPQRPLQVLCCTWNVGDAQPPANLDSWLRGVQESQHDVVAVGTQECFCRLHGHAEVGTSNSVASTPRAPATPGARSIFDSAAGSMSSPFAGGEGSHSGRWEGPMAFPVAQPRGTVMRQGHGLLPLALAGRAGSLQHEQPSLHRSPTGHHGKQRDFKEAWEALVTTAMGSNYWLLKAVHMGHIRLLVYVRNDLLPAVSDVRRGSQPTGIAGVYTNKGGVAVTMTIGSTELAFINSHLAAHQGKSAHRAHDYSNIIKGIRLDDYRMDLLTAPHHVIWMGDLNYRLDYGEQAITGDEHPDPADFRQLNRIIEDGESASLQQYDQLAKGMQAHQVFLGFREGAITFDPTFKVHRRPGLLYMQQRSPAWCDRVLWRSNLPFKQAKALDYFTAADIGTSDHKPVGAVLQVPTVRPATGDKAVNMVVQVLWLAAKGLPTLHPLKEGAKEVARELPSPKMLFLGPHIKDPDSTGTHVVQRTCDPKWRGPFSIQLKPAPLTDIIHSRILLRIVDRSRKRTDITIARGVLPLAEAASQLLAKDDMAAVRFSLQLEYNGLPAGTLEGQMQLVSADSAAPASNDTPALFSTAVRRASLHLADGVARFRATTHSGNGSSEKASAVYTPQHRE